MTGRAALLGATALVGAGAAFTVAASSAMLGLAGLWDHPYFAQGNGWTWAWLRYAADPAARTAMGQTLWISGTGAAVAIGAVAARLWLTLNPREKALHGRTAYADRDEAKRNGIAFTPKPLGDAILLGRTKGWLGLGRRYIGLPGTDHAALYAKTGAGKGVSFVVPACLSWEGSLVALDIKGELYRQTAGQRAALGQDVFLFAPTAPDGRTHRYNPFSILPPGAAALPDRIDQIHRIMALLVPPTSKAENPFWTNAARALAAGGAIMLSETPGATLSPAALLSMFTRPDHDTYLRDLATSARNQRRPLPRAAVDVVLSWVGSDDPKTREGIVEELKAHLAIYASPRIAAATETSDFDLRQLRSRPMSIFIGLTPDELRRLRPLTQVLCQQLISASSQVEYGQDPSHRYRVLVMLDEFWALGEMKVLADAAAFVRSYGIRMAYVVQTKAQLISIYGPEGSENLFQNTGAEIMFGASDLKLCREVSERAGFDTVTETTRNRPRFFGWAMPAKQSESESARRRALLLPQEVQRLPADEQLVFRPAMQPLRTARIRWFDDPAFRTLTRAAPPVPLLNVSVDLDAGTGRPVLAAGAEF